MSLGNDGFTDCSYVCNPENHLSLSCDKYCPGYTFISSTLTSPTTTRPVLDNITESDDVQMDLIVCLCIGAVLFAIVLITCLVNKNRIRDCLYGCRNKRLHQQNEVHQALTPEENADIERHCTSEDETKLLLTRREDGDSGNISNSSSDSVVRDANSTVHLEDETDVRRNTAVLEPYSSFERRDSNEPRNNITTVSANDNNHSHDETMPKEVGEVAVLAIGQRTYPCGVVSRNAGDAPVTPEVGEEIAGGNEHTGENTDENDESDVSNADCGADCDADVSDSFDNDENDENGDEYSDIDDDDDDEEEEQNDDDDDDDDITLNEASDTSVSFTDEVIIVNERLLNMKENNASNANIRIARNKS